MKIFVLKAYAKIIFIYIYICIYITDFSDSLSLAIRPYHPSLLPDLLDYTLCPHRAVVGKFLLVAQHSHVDV